MIKINQTLQKMMIGLLVLVVEKIVPRLVTYRGRATHSLCPYCASRVNEYGYCFLIATAIYKDYDHPQVMVLRDF